MNVHSDLGRRQHDQAERTTRRLDPPPETPTTRQALNDALLVERYGQTVPEWTGPHHAATPPVTADLGRGPVALRLVVDNTKALFETLGEVA